MHDFLFHTAFREQCPRKGGGRPSSNKKKQCQKNKRNKEQKSAFDLKVHNETMSAFELHESTALQFPHPKKPLSWRGFDQCKAVIEHIHTEQLSGGVNNKSWDVLWNNDLKKLQKHVKNREPALKKASHAEKQNGDFLPCADVARHNDIETELHRDAAEPCNERALHVRLRHRCCLLFSVSDVLWSDSLHKSEVSDFFSS